MIGYLGIFATGLGAGVHAAARMRSPIRLVKQAIPFKSRPMIVRRWTCDDERLDIAEFVNRNDRHETALVHRSTKTPGQWQLTWFDADGPVGDIQAASCTTALRDLSYKRWRLAKVIAR